MAGRRALHLLLLAVATASVVSGCGAGPDNPVPRRAPAEGEAEWFVDAAQSTGLDFVHFNGMSGGFYQPEIMAPGVGLFDYDNDGDLDVYLVQGQMLGTGK